MKDYGPQHSGGRRRPPFRARPIGGDQPSRLEEPAATADASLAPAEALPDEAPATEVGDYVHRNDPPGNDDLPGRAEDSGAPVTWEQRESLPTPGYPGAGTDLSAPAGGAGAAAADEEEDVPAAFRPRFSPDEHGNLPPRGVGGGALAAIIVGVLALGSTAGYFIGNSSGYATATAVAANQRTPPGILVPDATRPPPQPVSAALQAELDRAFEAGKGGRFDEAYRLFETLQRQHPEWPSMMIEKGRAALYQHNAEITVAALNAAINHGAMAADGNFLLALLAMTNKNYADAETFFARATGIDPARPDFYYFWGEGLRQQGKSREAMAKFRAAMLRNQYETSEGLFRLKYWLSAIQADQEGTDNITSQIDGLLTQPRPPMEALFAGAARALKAGQPAQAADLIRRARQLVEPSVYLVVLQDPVFLQESWRDELTEFYKPDNASNPAAAEAPKAVAPAASPAVNRPRAATPAGR